MKIDANKIIGLLVAALLAMASWYIVRLTDKVDALTVAVQKNTIAVEIAAGGNPLEEE